MTVEAAGALAIRIEVRPDGLGRLALDLGGLPAVYVVRVTTGAETASRRVVVAR